MMSAELLRLTLFFDLCRRIWTAPPKTPFVSSTSQSRDRSSSSPFRLFWYDGAGAIQVRQGLRYLVFTTAGSPDIPDDEPSVRTARAGSPWELPPRAATDPDVPVKEASGSSRCGFAVPHTTRSFRGDTLVRLVVLGVVPTPCPQRGAPFAPRGPEGPFRRFNATMRNCDSLPPISPRFRFLRFAMRVASPHARLASGCWPGSNGRDWLPAGFQRKVSHLR